MWPVASNSLLNLRQRKIRDIEWECVEKYIAHYTNGTFLDVGCGTGYAMEKAKKIGLKTFGIDPNSHDHGVVCALQSDAIVKGVAEKIPFPDDSFQVIYSSHALEHFMDREQGLSEIKRVVVRDGVVILVVPTGFMSLINLISQYVFLSHVRIAKFVLRKRSIEGFKMIFFPSPHGSYAKSVIGEIVDFGITKWRTLIGQFFDITEVILPMTYPYPDFPQFFPMFKTKKFSSSVIFICKSKSN